MPNLEGLQFRVTHEDLELRRKDDDWLFWSEFLDSKNLKHGIWLTEILKAVGIKWSKEIDLTAEGCAPVNFGYIGMCRLPPTKSGALMLAIEIERSTYEKAVAERGSPVVDAAVGSTVANAIANPPPAKPDEDPGEGPMTLRCFSCRSNNVNADTVDGSWVLGCRQCGKAFVLTEATGEGLRWIRAVDDWPIGKQSDPDKQPNRQDQVTSRDRVAAQGSVESLVSAIQDRNVEYLFPCVEAVMYGGPVCYNIHTAGKDGSYFSMVPLVGCDGVYSTWLVVHITMALRTFVLGVALSPAEVIEACILAMKGAPTKLYTMETKNRKQ